MMRRLLILLTFACVGIAGCTDAPTSPTPFAAYSQTDLRVGDGTEAVTGNSLTVNYTGWLFDPSKTDSKGLQFDSSIGGTPLVFTLGNGQVIDGWDRGVAGMKVGGTRRLVIPPSLAYGESRHGGIPPNSTLVFDITLVSIP